MKNCEYCQKNNLNRSSTKYCSRECYNRFRSDYHNTGIKKCTYCMAEKSVKEFRLRIDRINQIKAECKECEKTRRQKYNFEEPEMVKKWRQTHSRKMKLETLSNYSINGEIKCACCEEKTIEFLCIDHINGGGNKERKQLKREGKSFYYYLKQKNYPEGYRILCYNCNMAFGCFGYCPHTKPTYFSIFQSATKPIQALTRTIQ